MDDFLEGEFMIYEAMVDGTEMYNLIIDSG
jgi:hypothetical protein